VLAAVGLVTGLSLRDAPSASERAAAEVAERERIAEELEQALAREEAERAAEARAEAERALAEAEALAADGDLLAARDAFLEAARAGGELAAVALERSREMGAVYAEEATARLEELLAEERTAEALAHLQDTRAALANRPEIELFLDGARELVRDASAQLGPAWRALLTLLEDAAAGALATPTTPDV